jgi:hypothetical protein
MTTLRPSYFLDYRSDLVATLPQQGTAGIDPEFDDGGEKCQRLFAEPRVPFAPRRHP